NTPSRILNVLNRDRSEFLKPGPIMKFRTESPRLPVAGTANADGSKYLEINCPLGRSDGRLGFPIRLARVVWKESCVSRPLETEKGDPLRRVTMPLSCQPPSTSFAAALCGEGICHRKEATIL